MKSLSLIGVFIIVMCTMQGQSRVALTPGTAAHPSAILDLRTTQVAGQEQGFLMTKMDSAQRVNMAAPANALWLYQNKEDTGFYYYDVNRWRRAQMTYGAVQMDNNSSIVLNGDHTFNVAHIAPGIDSIYYVDALIPPPALGLRNHVIVTGENTEAPLDYHDNVANYCIENQNSSNGSHVNSFVLTNTTAGTTLIQNTNTGASPSTYYAHPLLDNSINDCISAGNTLNFNINPGGSFVFGAAIEVWVDWNADGDFATGESVYHDSYTAPVALPHNFNVTVPAIPAAAQATFTAVRVMTRTYATSGPSSTGGCLAPSGTTTSAEIEDYFIPLCTTGALPVLKPFCSVNNSNQRGFRIYCQDIDGKPINVKYHFKVHEK